MEQFFFFKEITPVAMYSIMMDHKLSNSKSEVLTSLLRCSGSINSTVMKGALSVKMLL